MINEVKKLVVWVGVLIINEIFIYFVKYFCKSVSKIMGCDLFCLLNLKLCMNVVEEVSKKVLICMVFIIFFVISGIEVYYIICELLELK